jgi:TonB family protein
MAPELMRRVGATTALVEYAGPVGRRFCTAMEVLPWNAARSFVLTFAVFNLACAGSSAAPDCTVTRTQCEAAPCSGWVNIEFTVKRSGAVSEPKVLSACPLDLFDEAALQAVSKWQYKPASDDRRGVRVRLDFELPANDAKPEE